MAASEVESKGDVAVAGGDFEKAVRLYERAVRMGAGDGAKRKLAELRRRGSADGGSWESKGPSPSVERQSKKHEDTSASDGGTMGDSKSGPTASSPISTEEMNREQAELCARRAQAAAKAGDVEKALRLYSKSLRMCELPGVRARRDALKASGGSTPTSTGDTSSTSGVRRRNTPSTPAPSPPQHSPELIALIAQVKRARGHYQVLGVPQDASSGAIKKAYKKLALKLHPDKCDAPGSEDAFKRVGAAMAVLGDAEKRRRYDVTGVDEDEAPAGPPHAGGVRRGYGGMSPEEQAERIFEEMFFGHGMGGMRGVHMHMGGNGVRMHFGRPRHHQQGHQGEDDPGVFIFRLLQFLPVLMLLLFALSSVAGTLQSGPPFRLQPVGPYSVRMHTRAVSGIVGDLPYFVTTSQAHQYKTDRTTRRRVEQLVESETRQSLSTACANERALKRQLNTATSNFRKQRIQSELARFTGSCSDYDRLFAKEQW